MIEDTLLSIDATLKALLTSAQSSASAIHTFGTVAEATLSATAKAPRKTKEPAAPTSAMSASAPLGLVDGDPEGTRYWVIEKHNTVYAQKPGDMECSIEGAKIESAAFYLEKKAEFAKKSLVPSVAATPTTTTAVPAAMATPATASTASASAPTGTAAVLFQDVTAKLLELSKDERPGLGRPALVTLLAKYLPDVDTAARKVPALAALGKNDAIMADLVALLAPAAVEDDIFA
jgi:hypothetical protein